MIDLSEQLSPSDLEPKLARLWELSALKIRAIEAEYDRLTASEFDTIGMSVCSRNCL